MTHHWEQVEAMMAARKLRINLPTEAITYHQGICVGCAQETQVDGYNTCATCAIYGPPRKG